MQLKMALPGMKAPDFAGVCNIRDEYSDVSLKDLISKGKWCLLFFYPHDFGTICPGELMELNAIKRQLKSLDCKIIGCSTDSAVLHNKFLTQPPNEGGIEGVTFPIIEDVNGGIAYDYGVMRHDSGYSFRAYFLIDNTGIIRARVVGDLPVALDIDGLPAKIKRIQDATAKKSWFQEMRGKMKED